MDKKNYVWIVVGVVVVAAVIYLMTSGSTPTNNVSDQTKTDSANNGALTPNQAAGQPAAAGDKTPIFTPEATPAKENIISVDGASFSPKNIDATVGSKIFMTFSAKDAKKHTFAFEDADLAFITVSFNKEEGDKSITFPAPKAGTYSFYVDSKDNKGSLTVK